MTEHLDMEILQEFYKKHFGDYSIHTNEVGRTLENLLITEKSKGVTEGIRFTLDYLANRNMINNA